MPTPVTGVNQSAIGFGVETFDSGAQPVNNSAAYQCIAVIQLGGNKTGVDMLLQVGSGNGLGGFKLTKSPQINGHAAGNYVDWMVDTDFNTATAECTSVVTSTGGTPNLNTLAASASALLKLDRQQGVQEIGVWAKQAAGVATTLEASGTAC